MRLFIYVEFALSSGLRAFDLIARNAISSWHTSPSRATHPGTQCNNDIRQVANFKGAFQSGAGAWDSPHR